MTPRIAIIGVGSIGSRHIDTLLAMGYTDLVGVDHRSMPADERLPIVATIADLGDWKPTHVLICSPPGLHYAHAMPFLQHSTPTFIEKPLAATVTEAKTLVAVAANEGALLACGYMERAHPIVAEAKQFALQHHIDDASFTCFWMAESKTYELAVVAESSHALDTARYVLGDIASVSVDIGETDAVIKCRHVNGRRSTVLMNMKIDPPIRRIFMHAANKDVFSESYGRTINEWDACYRAELQAFLDGKPLCTGKDGAAVVEILEQLR